MGRSSFCMRCGRSFGWRRRDIIVVYVDDVFVRFALDGLVPLILHFRVDLISALIILLQTFSFRILMPNKIHHRRRLNLHDLVMLL